MTVTTNEHGQNNLFAKEPRVEVVKDYNHFASAERLNGRLAMIGVISALGAYLSTGQVLPGIW